MIIKRVRLKTNNSFQTHVQTKMSSNEEDTNEIVSREEVLLNSLLRFYKQDSQNLNILAAISKQKTIISLREMDYTVTNYSNNNKVSYKLKNGSNFNMYLDYKCQLRGYSKKNFDPFCRRQRIYIDFESKTPKFLEDKEIDEYKLKEDGLVTTIGQLAFFRWAILNEVVDFCFNNKEKIDDEMEKMDKKKNEGKISENDKDVKSVKGTKDTKVGKVNSDMVKVIIQFP